MLEMVLWVGLMVIALVLTMISSRLREIAKEIRDASLRR